jgi:hypothetical protein
MNAARLPLPSQRVKAACKADPADVLVLPFDLLAPDADLEAAAAAADAAFGGAGIDFLVHNAGASQHALAEETTGEVTRQLLALKCVGGGGSGARLATPGCLCWLSCLPCPRVGPRPQRSPCKPLPDQPPLTSLPAAGPPAAPKVPSAWQQRPCPSCWRGERGAT